MLRYEVIFQALAKTPNASPSVVLNISNMLTNVCQEFGSFAFWNWLKVDTTFTPTASTGVLAFTSAPFSTAATAYDKGLSVPLMALSYDTFKAIAANMSSITNSTVAPQFYTVTGQGVTVFPALTTPAAIACSYYKKIGVAVTNMSTDIETDHYIPAMYHGIIANYGLPALIYHTMNDPKATEARREYLENVMIAMKNNNDYAALDTLRFPVANVQSVVAAKG